MTGLIIKMISFNLLSSASTFFFNQRTRTGTHEDADEDYDVVAIKFRGTNAVTNFDVSRYNVEKIIESSSLLFGELARRTKDVDPVSQLVLSDQLQNGEPKSISNETEPTGNGLGDSPKGNNLPMVRGMQLPPSNAWIPTAMETTTQLRSHIPIFAAWTDPSEKWLVLIGIAPGSPKRPQLVKGNMQLYSVDQQQSQALEAHVHHLLA